VAGEPPNSNPTLTVVVIVHDDARQLPVAVRSALGQTLRDLEVVVVDDASTDGSADVADALAADDARVRVLRRQHNSGGCSVPRNDGIAVARGRWVMFLDSDDELPPGAAAALVEAGERRGAEVASGLCQRVHVHARAVTPWFPELYASERVLDSLADEPELLYDTLATNKCYRRDFLERTGLRFPEGMHYEDLVFSARVYLAARRLVLVPAPVYRWNVRVDAETASISNRRADVGNVVDRVTAHRLVDAAVAEAGDRRVARAKAVKFVRHDLRLYLHDLWERDDDYRRAFLDVVGGYLAELDDDAWPLMPPLERAAAHLVRLGDLDAALDAVEALKRAGRLPTVLTRRDDACYLGWGHLDDGHPERLDVTGLERVAWPAYARLESARYDDAGLQLRLVVRSPLVVTADDQAAEPPEVSVALLRAVPGGRLVPLAVEGPRPSGPPALWHVDVVVPTGVLRPLPGPVNAWRPVVRVGGGRRLPVGRPHRWTGPLAVTVGAGARASVTFTRGGELEIALPGTLRVEQRVDALRLRARHTVVGTAARTLRAATGAVGRLGR
jgi:glycosyltransferase involved in cell wall biosynthesis